MLHMPMGPRCMKIRNIVNKHSIKLRTLHVKVKKKIHKINVKYEHQIRHTEQYINSFELHVYIIIQNINQDLTNVHYLHQNYCYPRVVNDPGQSI